MATPWMVRPPKRRSPATVPRSRKRIRLADDENSGAKRRQSTLTQLQFVQIAAVAAEDSDDLSEIVVPPFRNGSSRSESTRPRYKRSTLTQMDWLNNTSYKSESDDDGLLPLTESLQFERSIMQQLDGPADNLRSKKRRVQPKNEASSEFGTTEGTENKDGEAGDMSSIKKRGRTAARSKPSTTGLSAPKDTIIIAEQRNISGQWQSQQATPTRSTKRNKLSEIHDTYDLDETCLDDSRPKRVRHPRTPQKPKSDEIPSSQTPQSRVSTIRPHRFEAKMKDELRSPLKERSINLPSAFSRGIRSPNAKSRTLEQYQGKKVCVLKSSPHATISRPLEIENSQGDESQNAIATTRVHEESFPRLEVTDKNRTLSDDEVLEIPPSSQPGAASETEACPMNALPSVRSSSIELGNAMDVMPYGDKVSQTYREPPNTQRSTRAEQPSANYGAGGSADLVDDEDAAGFLQKLPNPKLIGPPVDDSRDSLDVSSPPLPNPGFTIPTLASSDRRNMRGVSLEDVRSSSISLGPNFPSQFHTQRSAHPAALPQFSQISTQEPTQGLPQSSIPVTQFTNGIDTNVERVTIKDSSSIDNRLSQIPEHSTNNYSAHCDSQNASNAEVELDDLDLDPDSPSRNSVRKPARLRSRKSQIRHNVMVDQVKRKDYNSSPFRNDREDNQSPLASKHETTDDTPRAGTRAQADELQSLQALLDTISSSPSPPPINTAYVRKPIPGFNNDTQSNFTQNGHISAAYIHRQREAGILPASYIPERIQIADSEEEEENEL